MKMTERSSSSESSQSCTSSSSVELSNNGDNVQDRQSVENPGTEDSMDIDEPSTDFSDSDTVCHNAGNENSGAGFQDNDQAHPDSKSFDDFSDDASIDNEAVSLDSDVTTEGSSHTTESSGQVNETNQTNQDNKSACVGSGGGDRTTNIGEEKELPVCANAGCTAIHLHSSGATSDGKSDDSKLLCSAGGKGNDNIGAMNANSGVTSIDSSDVNSNSGGRSLDPYAYIKSLGYDIVDSHDFQIDEADKEDDCTKSGQNIMKIDSSGLRIRQEPTASKRQTTSSGSHKTKNKRRRSKPGSAKILWPLNSPPVKLVMSTEIGLLNNQDSGASTSNAARSSVKSQDHFDNSRACSQNLSSGHTLTRELFNATPSSRNVVGPTPNATDESTFSSHRRKRRHRHSSRNKQRFLTTSGESSVYRNSGHQWLYKSRHGHQSKSRQNKSSIMPEFFCCGPSDSRQQVCRQHGDNLSEGSRSDQISNPGESTCRFHNANRVTCRNEQSSSSSSGSSVSSFLAYRPRPTEHSDPNDRNEVESASQAGNEVTYRSLTEDELFKTFEFFFSEVQKEHPRYCVQTVFTLAVDQFREMPDCARYQLFLKAILSGRCRPF